MIPKRTNTVVLALTLVLMLALVLGVAGARAAAPPVKLEPTASIKSGFGYPEGVAVAPNGNIYVTDRGHDRVQELTATGEFVLMFGREVDQTTKGDICTAASKDTCQAGVQGTGAGAFSFAGGVTVDPGTGNVYVQDASNQRVDEYTAGGQFVLMFGREVNETTKGNICTEEEIVKTAAKCKAGVAGTVGVDEHGAFDFTDFTGNILAVGPAPEHLLYVGTEQRIQEFDAQGEWKGEIPLTSISAGPGSKVLALAIDATGDVYLTYGVGSFAGGVGGGGYTPESTNMIHEFDPTGVEMAEFTVSPRSAGNEVSIFALALDAAGHLAVSVEEAAGIQKAPGGFGLLFEAGTGHLITEFSIPGGSASSGMAFNASPEAELYAVQGISEVLVYKPVLVAELSTAPSSCKAGLDIESDATLDCSLNGAVNPEGVPGTEAWVEWGRTPDLGEVTARQKVEAPVPLSATIEGVRPNETFYYRLAGYDQNVQPPERQLASETVSFTTPVVPPRIVGGSSAQFVRSSAAVLFGELNPENASTTYEFEYGACEDLEACPGVSNTTALESKTYGRIGATLEASGLQPATTYHYRLLASDEREVAGKTVGGQARGAQGVFTTGPAPVPSAITGAPSAIAATSATVSGSVDPDGQPATYTFELGVFEGAQTQFGTVFSGSAGAGTAAVAETLGLTGLQPGTTYAYRIKVASGYGIATGQTVTFTTVGLPSVLGVPAPLAMLATPNIAFPAVPVGGVSVPRSTASAQRLAKALRACRRDRSRKRRAACEKRARKQYARSKQANDQRKG